MFHLVVHRPVAVTMLSLAATLFGVLAYQQRPISLMPPLNYPTLTIQTTYDGAAPEEVESELTTPIEERLGTVEELTMIRSRSRAGSSEVQLEFNWGVNLNHALQRVYERLDRLRLPRGVDPPKVLRYDPTLEPVFVVALTSNSAIEGGPTLSDLRRYAEDVLTPMVHQLQGVAAVKVTGGLLPQIEVEVHPEALHRLGLSIQDVSDRIQASHVNLAGGRLKTKGGEILVRTLSELDSLEDLREVMIHQVGSTWIRLKDIANVRRGTVERKAWVQVGDEEAVRVQIYRQADANLVNVAQAVRELLFQPKIQRGFNKRSGRDHWRKKKKRDKKGGSKREGKRRGDKRGSAGGRGDHRQRKTHKPSASRLTDADFRSAQSLTLQVPHPRGVHAYLIQDQSRFIEDALSSVKGAIGFGGILAILILYLFLQSLYQTFVVAIAIPLSVVLSFIPLHFFGVSLNLMSLGGLALGVGMLVDNAVVVLESIARKREGGAPPLKAAVDGASEVGGAVLAATLTTVAVFAPVAFIGGLAGQVFRDLALTVVAALIASLVVALIVVPMLSGRMRSSTSISPSGSLDDQLTSSAKIPMDQVPKWWAQLKEIRWYFIPLKLLSLPLVLLETALSLTGNALLLLTALLLIVFSLPLKLINLLIGWPMRALGRAVGAGLSMVERGYLSSLKASLKRPMVILLFTTALVIVSWNQHAEIPRSLLPEVAQGVLIVELDYPVGTTIEETYRRTLTWIERLKTTPQLDRVEVLIGQDEGDEQSGVDRGPHQVRLTLNLKRRGLEEEVSAMLRDWVLGEPGATLNVKRPSLLTLRPPLRVVLKGHDLKALQEAEKMTYLRLRDLPALSDIERTFGQGYPEVQVQYDYPMLSRLGLSPREVAEQLRDQLSGRESLEVLWANVNLPVRVRNQGVETQNETDLPSMQIKVPAQLTPTSDPNSARSPLRRSTVPLASVATFVQGEGPAEIRHVNGQRAAEVSAYVSAFALGEQAQRVENILADLTLPLGVEPSLSGQDTEMKESLSQLSMILLLSLFLVYVVMTSQFESLRSPLLIMGAVPLAGVGVLLGLSWTHTPLSIVVFVGLITLGGVVVNNAIVYLDAAQRFHRRGAEKSVALISAGRQRLRPILMTTLTTLIGLTPMLSPDGEGAELRAPLALTLMFGLASSTLLVLFVLPALYQLFGRTPSLSDTEGELDESSELSLLIPSEETSL